jgi:hypothetical protein
MYVAVPIRYIKRKREVKSAVNTNLYFYNLTQHTMLQYLFIKFAYLINKYCNTVCCVRLYNCTFIFICLNTTG